MGLRSLLSHAYNTSILPTISRRSEKLIKLQPFWRTVEGTKGYKGSRGVDTHFVYAVLDPCTMLVGGGEKYCSHLIRAHLRGPGEFHPSRGGVEGGEEHVLGEDSRSTQTVEHCGFTRVRVAYERYHWKSEFLPRRAVHARR